MESKIQRILETWNKISHYGINVSKFYTEKEKSILLSNKLLMVFFFFAGANTFATLGSDITTAAFSAFYAGLYLSLLYLNKRGKHLLSRLVFSLFTALVPVWSVILNQAAFNQANPDLLRSIYALTACFAILPLVLFGFNEKKELFFSLLLIAFSISAGPLLDRHLEFYAMPLIHGSSLINYGMGFLAFMLGALYLKSVNNHSEKQLTAAYYEVLNSEEELKKFAERVRTANQEMEKVKSALQQTLANEQHKGEELQKANLALLESEKMLKHEAEMMADINNSLQITAGKLFEAQKKAVSASKAKTVFLANMSHEIRSPLNAISGFSQILRDDVRNMDLPLSFTQYLENIYLSSQNLSEVINNILDLSKIESGKMQLDIAPLNLLQLFQGIFHINKAEADKKGVVFNYDFDNALPQAIQSDRTKLNQMLMNLVSNAIKFTPKGKTVLMRALKKDGKLRFEVIDKGIGIPEERQKAVFEAFEQVDASTTRKFGGTGLGLAITKSMAELLEGKIGLESVLGEGTLFFIELALLEAEKNFAEAPGAKPFAENSFCPDNRILVVEDLQMNRLLIKAFFIKLKLEVVMAENGLIGVQKAKEMRPDLILMDIHMPEMDGLEAVKIMREDPLLASTPIVAVSAEAFAEHQKIAIDAGFDQYLTKPIDFGKLLPILKKYLRQPESAQDLVPSESPLSEGTKEEIRNKLLAAQKYGLLQANRFIAEIDGIIGLLKNGHAKEERLCSELEHALFNADQGRIDTLLDELHKSVS